MPSKSLAFVHAASRTMVVGQLLTRSIPPPGIRSSRVRTPHARVLQHLGVAPRRSYPATHPHGSAQSIRRHLRRPVTTQFASSNPSGTPGTPRTQLVRKQRPSRRDATGLMQPAQSLRGSRATFIPSPQLRYYHRTASESTPPAIGSVAAARQLRASTASTGPSGTHDRPLSSRRPPGLTLVAHALPSRALPLSQGSGAIASPGSLNANHSSSRMILPASLAPMAVAAVPAFSGGTNIEWPMTAGPRSATVGGMTRDVEGMAGSPVSGAIHLDGNLLGQWVTGHLEKAMLQPSRGPTGVDPRVVPGWGSFTAAY